MNKRSAGMILIATITMMTIVTMLVLALMKAVFLSIKATKHIADNHDIFYQLESVAQELIFTKPNPNCIVKNETENHVAEQLFHHEGCTYEKNNYQYHYLIDDLGVYPCLYINVIKGKKSSHHWLISVIAANSQRHILQIRVAAVEKAGRCELSVERQINEGILAWRNLPQ